jgi:hypothetical protein
MSSVLSSEKLLITLIGSPFPWFMILFFHYRWSKTRTIQMRKSRQCFQNICISKELPVLTITLSSLICRAVPCCSQTQFILLFVKGRCSSSRQHTHRAVLYKPVCLQSHFSVRFRCCMTHTISILHRGTDVLTSLKPFKAER